MQLNELPTLIRAPANKSPADLCLLAHIPIINPLSLLPTTNPLFNSTVSKFFYSGKAAIRNHMHFLSTWNFKKRVIKNPLLGDC
ncbi:MAG: hypothetical protein ACJAZP_003456 [Psychromonas sp.]|jgi:hypothetical protein